MAENKSSISQADSYEAIGEFWDTHDFTEFDDPQRPDVAFDIHGSVRIEAGLLSTLRRKQRRKASARKRWLICGCRRKLNPLLRRAANGKTWWEKQR